MAEIATNNSSDALDIVQEAMIKLVTKYSDKTASEWKPLFYRILQTKITDHFRRKTVHNRIFFWRNSNPHSIDGDDSFDSAIDRESDNISLERRLSGEQDIQKVSLALKQLSPRQQQCFLLRSWEGLSVSETAEAMKCSEGSVKTHYSRAKDSLKKALNDE